MSTRRLALIIAAILLALAVLGNTPDSKQNATDTKPQGTHLASVTEASSESSTLSGHTKWVYNETLSPMGGMVRTGSTPSLNTLSFDFPYSGTQNAKLTIRKHPSWGTHIYVSIQKGQILCDDFDNDTVRVRFDQKPPINVTCVEPTDHDSRIVFLNSESSLIEKIRKANKMTVELTFYQEGVRHLEFDTHDFDPAKLGLGGLGREKAQK